MWSAIMILHDLLNNVQILTPSKTQAMITQLSLQTESICDLHNQGVSTTTQSFTPIFLKAIVPHNL